MTVLIGKSTLRISTLVTSVALLLFVMAPAFFEAYELQFNWEPPIWISVLIFILILVCPVVSVVFWGKDKFSIKSLFLYSFILSVVTWVILLKSLLSIQC